MASPDFRLDVVYKGGGGGGGGGVNRRLQYLCEKDRPTEHQCRDSSLFRRDIDRANKGMFLGLAVLQT